MKRKALVLVAVRLKSKRLPRKALLDLHGEPLIIRVTERVNQAKLHAGVVWCSSTNRQDDPLEKLATARNISIFRGSELDVMSRFIEVASQHNATTVIRVTGDDILIDDEYFQISLDYFLNNNFDYVDHKNLISGTETEIFDYNVLKFIYKNSKNLDGTEYLTNYVKDNEIFFNIGSSPVQNKHKCAESMTIDTKDDYLYASKFLKSHYKKNQN